jgi:acyl-CoA reductase-like NAD-dependent aldehyde dehydrogenase
MQVGAETVKRVNLELGGKSANIICEDADLATAVSRSLFGCFINSGQTCSALTRMIVPRSRLAEVEEIAAQGAAQVAVGDPMDSGNLVGPLVSAVQRDRVLDYIRSGLDEGAKLIAGGLEPPAGTDGGFYVAPTIFSEVTPSMRIFKEEIFGPVLSIIPVDSEEEAIAVANDSIYGLSGAVWAATPERAEQVARQLRTGQVDLNGGAFNTEAPFGGYKQSGNGRERGRWGLEEFLETKAMQR